MAFPKPSDNSDGPIGMLDSGVGGLSILVVWEVLLRVIDPEGFVLPPPTEIVGVKTVTAQEARQLFDRETLFIDVRKNSDWEAGRIPGAEHLELKKVFSPETLGEIAGKNEPVVIFHASG